MRAREDVGGDRRGTFGTNLDQGRGKQRKKKSGNRWTKPIGKGRLGHEGTNHGGQHEAKQNPPQHHARTGKSFARKFQVIRPTRLERHRHTFQRRTHAIPYRQVRRIRIRRDFSGVYQTIHNPPGHNRDQGRKQNECEHPFPTDQGRKDQRQ